MWRTNIYVEKKSYTYNNNNALNDEQIYTLENIIHA